MKAEHQPVAPENIAIQFKQGDIYYYYKPTSRTKHSSLMSRFNSDITDLKFLDLHDAMIIARRLWRFYPDIKFDIVKKQHMGLNPGEFS